MKRECRPYWEGVIDLAEGRSSPAAKEHLSTCPDCAAKLEQMKQVISAARAPWFFAPAEASLKAKALMPSRARRRAALVGSTLAGAFARNSTEDFQVTLDLGGPRMRMMVAREESGWSLVVQTPSEDWTVIEAGGDLRSDSGRRFRILVPNLDASAFVLRGPDYDIDVPSMSEILNDRA